MSNKINLAKFIHKFETDLEYRKHLTETFENEAVCCLADDIACDSIDWIYFPNSESNSYPELSAKAYKETNDHYLCVEMIEIKNEEITDKYAELIIRTTNDIYLTDKYKELMILLAK